ncbi:MAG: carbonic anhydrase family protein [Rikenellaceae bacterium]
MKGRIFTTIIASTLMLSCVSSSVTTQSVEVQEPMREILHKADVAAMSPDSVLSILKSGNDNFVSGSLQPRDAMAQLTTSAVDGQAPLAIVLSCIDSRVPVEILFDKGVGDLFVTRVAGNVVSGDILGSMEYACEHAGSKVVLVLGHESCGAVHSACEGAEAGNMTAMLAKIKPAIAAAGAESDLDHHSLEFQNLVVEHNVKLMIDEVRRGSEILSHLEEEGTIKIVGAIFSLTTGEVTLLD